MQAIFGMFIADLSNHAPAQNFIARYPLLPTIGAPIFIAAGLWLASYPGEHPEWSPWAEYLWKLSFHIFPHDSDTPRFYSAIGFDLVVIGIYLSSLARRILGSRHLLWLGKNSFAVYLLHGTLLRVVLTWMLYGFSANVPQPPPPKEGQPPPPPNWVPRRGNAVMAISIPIWLLIVYAAAYGWTNYVDPQCASATRWLVKRATAEQKDEDDRTHTGSIMLLPQHSHSGDVPNGVVGSSAPPSHFPS